MGEILWHKRTQSGTGVWWQEITRSIKYFSSEGGICILVWSVFLFKWCFLFLKQFWKVLESIVGNLRKYSGPMNQTVGSGLLLKSQLVRHVFKLYSVWGSGWWCCCLSLSGVRKSSSKEKNLQPLLHTCQGSARSWQGSFAASSPAHVWEGEGGSEQTAAVSSISPGFLGCSGLTGLAGDERATQELVCCVATVSCLSFIFWRPWSRISLDAWQPLLQSLKLCSSILSPALRISASWSSTAIAGSPASSMLGSESFRERDPEIETLQCLAAFSWGYWAHFSVKIVLLALEVKIHFLASQICSSGTNF